MDFDQVDFDQDGAFGQDRFAEWRARPRTDHRISLTLSVVDAGALWAAAAATLAADPGMTPDDVLDAIGPREAPMLGNCIAAIARPIALAGCALGDFRVDSVRTTAPRIALAGDAIEYRMTAAELSPSRPSHKRRPTPHLALCMLPPLHQDAGAAVPPAAGN